MQKGNGVLFSFWWAIRTEVRGSTLLRHNSGICYLKKKKRKEGKDVPRKSVSSFFLSLECCHRFFFFELHFTSLFFLWVPPCVCVCVLSTWRWKRDEGGEDPLAVVPFIADVIIYVVFVHIGSFQHT